MAGRAGYLLAGSANKQGLKYQNGTLDIIKVMSTYKSYGYG